MGFFSKIKKIFGGQKEEQPAVQEEVVQQPAAEQPAAEQPVAEPAKPAEPVVPAAEEAVAEPAAGSGPGLDIEIPRAELGVDIPKPEIGVETPQVEVGVESPGVDIGVETPAVEVRVDVPDVDIELETPGVATPAEITLEQPAAGPVELAEPVEQPVEEPAPVELAEPAEQPVEEPAPVELAEPAEQPAEEPAPVELAEPAEQPVEEPAPVELAEPAEQPVEEAAPVELAEPAEQPVEEPAPVELAEPAEQPAEEPAPVELAEPAEQPAEEPAPVELAEPAEQPVEEPAPVELAEPAEQPVEAPAPVELADPAEQPAEEPAPVGEQVAAAAPEEPLDEEPLELIELVELTDEVPADAAGLPAEEAVQPAVAADLEPVEAAPVAEEPATVAEAPAAASAEQPGEASAAAEQAAGGEDEEEIFELVELLEPVAEEAPAADALAEAAAATAAAATTAAVAAATQAPAEPARGQDPVYAELTTRLREAEARLSVWLDIVLDGVQHSGELLNDRVRFLLRTLEAPADEAENFVQDFAGWLDRMEYHSLDEFRSELQYRLALALDLEDEEDERNRLFLKLSDSLAKTRAQFARHFEGLISSHGELNEDFWEELEELFIMSDLGVDTSLELVERLRTRAREQKVTTSEGVREILRDEIRSIFTRPRHIVGVTPPEVVLMIGVNGAGKTTTIAKLAYRDRMQGKKVMVAAADTFRAAAIDQLKVWTDRVGALFHAKNPGSDPASVAYEALDRAIAEQVDVLYVDTAGRLQTKTNLMEELSKIRKVIARKHPGAPHRTVLVLDATTGQNALSQAKLFKESAGVDELILTKLDGTAKGGVAIAVAMQYKLPITFVGLGEKVDDLRPFNGDDYADALLES